MEETERQQRIRIAARGFDRTRGKQPDLSECPERPFGHKLLSFILSFTLAFPAWIVVPAVEAALIDQTVTLLPADTDDSYRFATADIDGDNDLDVVVANRGQSRLLINDGGAGFTDETASRLPLQLNTTIAITLGDVDGDNDVDLVLGNTTANRILINDGSGIFNDETASRLQPIIQITSDVSLGDVDGDDDLDLLITNRNSQNRLYINDGSGVFTDATSARISSDSDRGHAGQLVDLDGDGFVDIFFVNHAQQNRLLINDRLGFFTDVTGTALPEQANESLDAEFFDFDGDGDTDIVVADGDAGVTLLENDGAAFTDVTATRLPTLNDLFVIRVDTGDLDYDGSLDILLANSGQNRSLLNDGSGNFSDATAAELPVSDELSFDVMLLDADNDLDLDALVATPQGQNRLLINDLPFPRIQVTTSPDYIEVTDTVTITVTAFDEDGVVSTVVSVVQPDTTQISVTLSGGTGHFIPSQIGAHRVVVEATDSEGNSGTMSAKFDALANDVTPPLVSLTVTPDSVLQGQSVAVQVNTSDDRSVASTSLQIDGVAVPLDSSGRATYVALTTGALLVQADASDTAGNTGSASATLDVTADLAPPVPSLDVTPASIDITHPIFVTAGAADNVSVSSLLVTVTGPAAPAGEEVTLNSAGEGSYTPYLPGTYTFMLTATDPAGNTATTSSNVEAHGIPDAEAPVVTLTITPSTTIPGGTVTLTVNATDNVFVLFRELTINGTPVLLDDSHQASFTAPVLGDYTALATASDPTGNTGSDTVLFSAVDPATDTEAPVVDITGPAEGSDISGHTEFIGIVSDLTLVRYEMAYAPVDSSVYTTFAIGSTPVMNALLGSLDTSVLNNGMYNIRLSAEDINGRTSQTVHVYTASGEFKPGIFTISYVDLEIPVTGIPITVRRSYDSRRRDVSSDFGYGWDLEVVQKGTYVNNRALGQGWWISSSGGFFNWPCSISNEDLFHITEVRFSDTEYYKFSLSVEYSGLGSVIGGGCTGGVVTFTQVGGVPGATLQVINGDTVFWPNGSSNLTYEFYDDRFGQQWNPQKVRLTTLDGRVYDLDLDNGLERIADNNGNSLFISDGGVVHSSGKSIDFTRDGQGRITHITDPGGNIIDYLYDVGGDLQTHSDQNGNETSFHYQSGHYLSRIDDPLGNTPLRNEYDADGILIAQIDADGNRTEFSHDRAAEAETIVNPEGDVTILQYSQVGRIQSAARNGVENTYTYDDRGNKLTETDGNGNTKLFSYDSRDQMTSETDALGNTYSYSYDANGRISDLVDADGNELNLAYDARGNVTEQRDAAGNLIQGFSYDGTGRVSQLVTAGGTTNFTYDSFGNMTSRVSPGGSNESYTHDALGRVTSKGITRTVGGTALTETTTYAYDARGNRASITDPLGNTTAFTYNGKDKVLTRTDTNGNRVDYLYDARDNLVRKNHPDGTFEMFTYNQNGYKTAHLDRAGRTTFIEYDSEVRPVLVVYPDGGQLQNVYDDAGNLLSQTDANGNTTSYTYDAIKRVVEKIDALGNISTLSYNRNQMRPSTVTDANGNTLALSYDTRTFLSEKLTRSTLPDGSFVQQEWGDNGRITSRTDANGNIATFNYDAVGNLAQVTDALGNNTGYTYDEVGNRLTQTDANGNTTSFRYDANGRLTGKTLPSGDSESMVYDAVGNLTSRTDFNGNTTAYEYDNMNRLIRQTVPGVAAEEFTYTAGDKLASVNDARGLTTFTYDARDRLTQIRYPGGVDVDITYDMKGNRTSIIIPAGSTNYTYDALDRIASLTGPDGGLTRYSYDEEGNIVGIAYPNGTEAALVYDSNDRTVQVTHTGSGGTPVLARFQYTLDDNGNRIRMIESAGRQVDYAYDAVNRLINENEGGVATSYNYDAAGNIILISDSASGNLAATYDSNNQILTAGGRDFSFDDNGNLTAIVDGAATTTFEYDSHNRLVRRMAPDGAIAEFEYDHEGNRIGRTVAGTQTRYIVDPTDGSGLAQVLMELDDSGTTLASYVYGSDLISMKRGAATSVFHTDALGSTRLLTDTAASVTDRYAYDGFGLETSASGSTDNDYRFAGEQYDPELGLYYLRARYYDPEIARFLTRDPEAGEIFSPVTQHPYAYGWNNPVNVVDPTGRFGLVSISISISINVTLASIAYSTIIKPAIDIHDKLEELLEKIPNMRLNESASADDLGEIGFEDGAPTIELGDGSVGKAYEVVDDMVTDAGKWVSGIHKWNSANWLKSLPAAGPESIPGGYVSCGFNHFVQKQYGLGLVTSLKAASRFSLATNIIGTYMAYFTFLALMGSTIDEWAGASGGGLLQPPEDEDEVACPGLGL